jgi:hypothetical protein
MVRSKSWSGWKAVVIRCLVCAGPPAVLGWATGNLPEPRNNPQIGMANLRGVMPALQRAKPFRPAADGARFLRAAAPRQQRETRVVKDLAPVKKSRAKLPTWISKGLNMETILFPHPYRSRWLAFEGRARGTGGGPCAGPGTSRARTLSSAWWQPAMRNPRRTPSRGCGASRFLAVTGRRLSPLPDTPTDAAAAEARLTEAAAAATLVLVPGHVAMGALPAGRRAAHGMAAPILTQPPSHVEGGAPAQ